jgi:hypothetical protein
VHTSSWMQILIKICQDIKPDTEACVVTKKMAIASALFLKRPT